MSAAAPGPVVLPDDDPRLDGLLAAGWTVAHESFGAQVDLTAARVEHLRDRSAAVPAGVVLRPLTADDVDVVLALDAATLGDHPGGAATAHAALDRGSATPSSTRRGWGAVDAAGRLIAMTWVDLPADAAAGPAEVDVTVVAADRRGTGVATALKAASLVALATAGVTAVRTGGSAENAGIRRAGAALGFVEDERWLTLVPPRAASGASPGSARRR